MDTWRGLVLQCAAGTQLTLPIRTTDPFAAEPPLLLPAAGVTVALGAAAGAPATGVPPTFEAAAEATAGPNSPSASAAAAAVGKLDRLWARVPANIVPFAPNEP
jgi:hypothetical protein